MSVDTPIARPDCCARSSRAGVSTSPARSTFHDYQACHAPIGSMGRESFLWDL
jgi:hypothetical protein